MQVILRTRTSFLIYIYAMKKFDVPFIKRCIVAIGGTKEIQHVADVKGNMMIRPELHIGEQVLQPSYIAEYKLIVCINLVLGCVTQVCDLNSIDKIHKIAEHSLLTASRVTPQSNEGDGKVNKANDTPFVSTKFSSFFGSPITRGSCQPGRKLGQSHVSPNSFHNILPENNSTSRHVNI